MKSKFYWVIVAILSLLFLFTRLYNINNSLFFINDTGRDMNVMQSWKDTGKPPLLGPQTSTLPINQSALYFYILYPGFLISESSPVAQNYILAFFYLFIYIGFAIKFKHYLVPLVFYLITIQPQLITQNRSVWNPSFVSPLIFISIVSFYFLLKKYSQKLLIIFSLSISLAISFSYSAAPILILFVIYWLITNRQNFLKYVFSIGLFLTIINFPTIIFEARHRILLPALFKPNSLITQLNLLPSQKTATAAFCLVDKPSYYYFSIVLATLVLATSIYKKNKFSGYVSFLYLGQIILLYLIPITVQCHYLFPLLSTGILLISILPWFLNLPLIILLTVLCVNPHRLTAYFDNAPRTYSQMESCFQKYCQEFKSTTYVSVVSGYLPWHFGPEHRYLLKKSGCNLKAIESENGQAEYMTLILDNGTYSPNTKFYELDLFGPHKEFARLKCQNNFEIVTLKKLPYSPTPSQLK